MVRLYVFAEGQTDQTFADIVLGPHLNSCGVYHHSILVSKGRRSGKVHRGGGRNYLPIRDDIKRFLDQQKGTDVFFTTMIDLYAIPTSFPEFKDAEKLRHLPKERVAVLEAAFAKDVGDSRFIPHFQTKSTVTAENGRCSSCLRKAFQRVIVDAVANPS
jgi:hypothetical protein